MKTDSQPSGCLTALLDLSFTQYVTTKILKWLYVLLLALVVIGGVVGVLAGLVTMFRDSFLAGLATILLSAISVLIYAVLARVWIELIMVIFRIAENTSELVRQGRDKSP